MNEPMSSKLMLTRLNNVMVEGIDILSVKKLPETAGNAMASVAAASYTVKIRKGHERDDFSFTKEFYRFMSQNEILIEKETKKRNREKSVASSADSRMGRSMPSASATALA